MTRDRPIIRPCPKCENTVTTQELIIDLNKYIELAWHGLEKAVKCKSIYNIQNQLRSLEYSTAQLAILKNLEAQNDE